MPDHDNTCDVVIVGGGVIGLAVAWRARARGLSVVVLERDDVPARGSASWVAAGMLAPVAEADAGERALLALGLQSAARWPTFAAELADVSGMASPYATTGTLVVARDTSEAAWLEHELAFRSRTGLAATRLLPGEARALEPALAPTLRAAMEVPDDHAADPRLLAAALAQAARRVGVDIRPGVVVEAVLTGTGGVLGVALADGEELHSGAVVLAAGAWSGALAPPEATVPLRPVKGQILRLTDPAGPGLLTRTLRYETGYLVPRGDGRYVLGATMEEQGFDTTVTTGAVHDLIRDASELVPGVLELVLEEARAGLRPSTPDNAPILGEHPACPGLHYATGHHRHGILLAPVTADLLAAGLAGEPQEHAFAPDRFAGERLLT